MCVRAHTHTHKLLATLPAPFPHPGSLACNRFGQELCQWASPTWLEVMHKNTVWHWPSMPGTQGGAGAVGRRGLGQASASLCSPFSLHAVPCSESLACGQAGLMLHCVPMYHLEPHRCSWSGWCLSCLAQPCAKDLGSGRSYARVRQESCQLFQLCHLTWAQHRVSGTCAHSSWPFSSVPLPCQQGELYLNFHSCWEPGCLVCERPQGQSCVQTLARQNLGQELSTLCRGAYTRDGGGGERAA